VVVEDVRGMNWAAWAGVVWSESGCSYSLTLPGGFLGSSCALPGTKRPCALRVVASFKAVEFHPPLNIPLPPPEPQAAIVFNLANNGRSAAHNVRCEFRFEEQHL
jgi:hypothetical protein